LIMDEQQYEDRLKQLDEETRSDRVQRWGELSHIVYVKALPKLLWEYSAQAIQLYINGNFGAVILCCASMFELILADQLINRGKISEKKVSKFNLEEKTRICRKLGIITAEDEKNIDGLRKFRNDIIHVNTGKLAEMAKKSYGDVDADLYEHLPELYLSNLGGGIQSQALEYFEFTRELTVRWYGENPTDANSG